MCHFCPMRFDLLSYKTAQAGTEVYKIYQDTCTCPPNPEEVARGHRADCQGIHNTAEPGNSSSSTLSGKAS